MTNNLLAWHPAAELFASWLLAKQGDCRETALVDCGAKHLVFLSRAGVAKNEDDLKRFADRLVCPCSSRTPSSRHQRYQHRRRLVSDSSHFTAAGEFDDLDNYLGRYQHGWHWLQTNLEELGGNARSDERPRGNRPRSPSPVVLGLGNRIEHRENSGGYTADKKFALRVVRNIVEEGDGGKQDAGILLSSATSTSEAVSIVEEGIKELVAAAMSISLDGIDGQKPLYDYGDPQSGSQNMKSDISVFDILSAMPGAEVAGKIAAKSQLVTVLAGED
ncbi:lovastatin nonaketide synthase [Cordyceps fumosorosea ARSEF 2679]|uniref:Lovastatin nonaketide synthase n=1 Tax=Cordyceps fumosorosea (strain ARSEF 2679) TaxID=1081104 RepID=A0A168BS46_CORFA|nr:lovastatin nonaketide synthase [Cordyceps fumosorosea ARSEF 2679]OAA70477.1 lovastatin nonaketide synthase [Cordyceps fumosorosea ARSEF 2679]